MNKSQIENLDQDIIIPERNSMLLCLLRINAALRTIGGEKRVGALFLWDTTIQNYDSIWGFHVWLRKNGSIYDSHSAITDAVEAHKLSGLDFGIDKPVEKWNVTEVISKKDKIPSAQYITQAIRKYRNQKIDAVYVENFINLEALKGVNEFARQITAFQKGRFTNETMLHALRNNNDV